MAFTFYQIPAAYYTTLEYLHLTSALVQVALYQKATVEGVILLWSKHLMGSNRQLLCFFQERKHASVVQSLRDTFAEILTVASVSFAFLLH